MQFILIPLGSIPRLVPLFFKISSFQCSLHLSQGLAHVEPPQAQYLRLPDQLALLKLIVGLSTF